jgi:hypothetical protein
MAGRPTSYKPEYCKQVQLLCMLGATNKLLAEFFGVNEDTIHTWKKQHVEFSEALSRGRLLPDAKVAQSLYKRAIGYEHKAVKIMQFNGEPVIVPYTQRYPPDTLAAIKWLSIRRPDLWRDKQFVGLEFEKLSDDQVRELYDRVLSALVPSDNITDDIQLIENEQ